MTEKLLLAVGFTWGIKALFEEPFLFWKVGQFLDFRLPQWIRKPLYRCVVCMASVWGTVFYWVLVGSNPLEWIAFCIAICGINFILIELIYPEE